MGDGVQALIGITFSDEEVTKLKKEGGKGPLDTLKLLEAACVVGKVGLPMVAEDEFKESDEVDARFIKRRDEETRKRAASLVGKHFYPNICKRLGYSTHSEVCLAMLVYGACLDVADDAMGVVL